MTTKEGSEVFGLTTAEAWPWVIGLSALFALVWFARRRRLTDLWHIGLGGITFGLLAMGLIILAVTLANPWIQEYNASLPPPSSKWQPYEGLPDGTPCWYTITQVGAYTGIPMNMEVFCGREEKP